MPVKTVTVTTGNHRSRTRTTDQQPRGGRDRRPGQHDPLRYDTGGFSTSSTTPTRAHAERPGRARNTIQQITCQDQSANLCSSTLRVLPELVEPGRSRNDEITATADGRSGSSTDTLRTNVRLRRQGQPARHHRPAGPGHRRRPSPTARASRPTTRLRPRPACPRRSSTQRRLQSIVYYANGDIAKTTSPAARSPPTRTTSSARN